ncbi:uncharacterized protein TNCV_2942031 [Trichonephila clavipes]|nr:uncharacterized protein TNCV_2942031 [Trichonephila clavipes]
MKTVTYRPQANLTERVNRNLVQMIACFVKENHENWDRFLHEFAFALRTSVNETTNKTLAELFLGRKIITPFSKLINVTEGAEYVGRNIEKLFDEARQNRRKQHKHWENIIIGKGGKLTSKGGGKKVTVNIDQVRVYRPRQSDTISSDSHVETLYEGQRSSDRSSRSQPGKFKGSRKTSSEQNNGHKSSKGNAGWEDPRLKRKVDSNGSGDGRNIKKSFSSTRFQAGQVTYSSEQARRKRTIQQGPVTKTTKDGTNRAAERRTVRSKQTTAVRPCPYYLRSRVRQPEGFPEERRNSGLASIPQNNIRRRSLSMEALDGDPVDRSE